MFASSPALNALEHPVYDVWVQSSQKRRDRRRVIVGTIELSERTDRAGELVAICVARYLHRPELAQVVGDKLTVQQGEAAGAQPSYQMHQGDLEASVSRLNMLSPKNAPPRTTPYKPPTS